MKKILGILFIVVVTISCKKTGEEKIVNSVKKKFQEAKRDTYELYKPTKKIKAVLILFGGYPEKIEDIKREFKILEDAKNKGVSVLFMDYNQKLWLEQNEKLQLAEQLQKIFKEHKLPTDNIYIGGFSSGGNIALLISDFITYKNLNIIPKGVFIVDSPIDLAALYNTVKKNIKRNFSKPAVQESTWLLKTLSGKFGNSNENISKYEEYAVFTSKTNNISNIKNLHKSKIRLYTEPDTIWWKKNRRADYEQLNAYRIKKLSETLHKLKFNTVEYIPTKNKGYRANGERHPHSWAIIDSKNLIEWMLHKPKILHKVTGCYLTIKPPKKN